MANRLRNVVLVLGALAVAGLSGCREGRSKSDLALTKAQHAVDVALDGWTRGEPADKFACSDPDWKAGTRLVSFLTSDAQVVDTDGSQVRCQVSLTFKDRQGKQRERQVAYLVQLGDPVTIRRDQKQ